MGFWKFLQFWVRILLVISVVVRVVFALLVKILVISSRLCWMSVVLLVGYFPQLEHYFYYGGKYWLDDIYSFSLFSSFSCFVGRSL